jgi:hypothetical protein
MKIPTETSFDSGHRFGGKAVWRSGPRGATAAWPSVGNVARADSSYDGRPSRQARLRPRPSFVEEAVATDLAERCPRIRMTAPRSEPAAAREYHFRRIVLYPRTITISLARRAAASPVIEPLTAAVAAPARRTTPAPAMIGMRLA